MTLAFCDGGVTIDNGAQAHTFCIGESRFLLLPDFDLSGLACAGGCDGCSGCQ